VCLHDDCAITDLLAQAPARGPEDGDEGRQALIARGHATAECLILTTAGTTGDSKLVVYRQEAFLRSCQSWETAGLFDDDRLGGPGLCLLFSHSMGIRAFWNAIWTGQPLYLIPPEWFLEHPARVRSLLSRMQPRHVTGGPAVFHALLELARVFPDLKEHGIGSLRCAVSSGAPFDPDMAQRVRTALGLDLQNAFGTTETMQVLSTLVGSGDDRGGMGRALPGVQIALAPVAGERTTWALFVHSPFGCAGSIEGSGGTWRMEPAPFWYATGDLVERTGAGMLRFVGRERDEFVKDGIGVKIPRRLVAARYANLGTPVRHVEWYPLRHEPGLGALIYVESGQETAENGNLCITDRRRLRTVRRVLEARHELFQADLDEFDLRHSTIARFACLFEPPPLTVKGTVAVGAIRRSHQALLDALLGHDVRHAGIVRLDLDRLRESNATRVVRPRLGRLLRLMRLDKHYVGGRGDRLTLDEQGRRREVVDFVGGFGTTLLGHRHPHVMEAATQFLGTDAIPLADQGSDRPAEGAFARRLAHAVARRTGGSYVVRFGSTGAEVVEMALAHAFLERDHRLRRFQREQRRQFGAACPERVAAILEQAETAMRDAPLLVLAIAGAFHGTSLGARAVSHLRQSRPIFEPMTRLDTIFLPPDGEVDVDRIVREAELTVPALAWRDGQVVEEDARFSRIICAFAEPIRGEGGVTCVSPSLLDRLGQYEFPLILDEIQCGMGRSGDFPAFSGMPGAYYLLGKALGGGLAKIAAVLVDKGRYVERFDEYYAGTFSGDAYSCAIASAALDVIERDDVPARARARGAVLRARLESVQREFPTVIRAVEGAGLMLGVELAPEVAADSLLVRIALEGEQLGLLAATYLLNRWDVRVLPTLSAPNTLRVEPSAYVDDAAIDALARGLRAFCRAVADRDLAKILAVLVDDDMALDEPAALGPPAPAFSARCERPGDHAVRVAFLGHFVLPERELAFIEPSLRRLPHAARSALVQRLSELTALEPTVAMARNLFGGRIWFAVILLPVDAATLEHLHRSGRRDLVVRRIQESLDLARQLGCTVAGLGAHTSIITDDGRALMPPRGMTLSTGNSLTVAVGVRRVLQWSRRVGLDLAAPGTRLGLLGATGNIGTALAHRFAREVPRVNEIVLVGRRPAALQALASALRSATGGHATISWSTDLSALRACRVIVAATGASELLLEGRHLPASGPVVVADLSVPSIVAPHVTLLPHVHVVGLAGTVAVPGTPDFAMASHIAAGRAFACAGETMLLGLAPDQTAGLRLVGPVCPASVDALERLADRWGLLDSAQDLADAEVQA
jgi:acetylornithine/succinyldiaminopimelate/putrescine aminotransferase/predicted amino acid dehydrogenase